MSKKFYVLICVFFLLAVGLPGCGDDENEGGVKGTSTLTVTGDFETDKAGEGGFY